MGKRRKSKQKIGQLILEIVTIICILIGGYITSDIENPNNEIIANYPNAYIEKLDFELELTPYNNGENASNPLDYNISQIELETSIDLES